MTSIDQSKTMDLKSAIKTVAATRQMFKWKDISAFLGANQFALNTKVSDANVNLEWINKTFKKLDKQSSVSYDFSTGIATVESQYLSYKIKFTYK